MFDFDGTLYAGDSFAEYLRYQIRGSVWRSLLALLVLPFAGPALLLTRTRQPAASLMLWIATLGLDERRLINGMEQFAYRRLQHPDGSGFFYAAIEQLRNHQRNGEQVVVATAAGEPLVKTLLRMHGVDVVVVGSTLRRCCGGMICDFYAYGLNKLKRLQDAGYPHGWSKAYSDSLKDLPLLSAAAEAVVINASVNQRRQFQQALSIPVTFIRWS